MSDPKREKLEAEAREFLREINPLANYPLVESWAAKHMTRLADWAERREREAVAEALKEWRAAESLPDCPACAALEASK